MLLWSRCVCEWRYRIALRADDVVAAHEAIGRDLTQCWQLDVATRLGNWAAWREAATGRGINGTWWITT